MLALLALLFAAPPDCAPAQDYGRATACEVRTLTLGASDALSVRNRVTGSIRVVAWERDEIGVRAEVRAYETDGRSPEALLAATEILASGGTLAPQTEGGGWVETQFVISVPTRTDLDLYTNDGAIAVTGVTGTLRIDTNHGDVQLSGVGGNVTARSNSGNVDVDLNGTAWDGEGLRASANFGTLRLLIPERYDAIVEAYVNWGYINEADAQSPARESRRVYIGAGGATLNVSANAGSVLIERG